MIKSLYHGKLFQFYFSTDVSNSGYKCLSIKNYFQFCEVELFFSFSVASEFNFL